MKIKELSLVGIMTEIQPGTVEAAGVGVMTHTNVHPTQVMQLEVVRPDESSSQDHVQQAAVGTSVIVIIVICSIVGVTIIVALFFFVST